MEERTVSVMINSRNLCKLSEDWFFIHLIIFLLYIKLLIMIVPNEFTLNEADPIFINICGKTKKVYNYACFLKTV